MSVSAPSSSLAELLKKYRSAARLSQEELAERAGVSTRTVSDIECGAARSPRAITLSLLIEALDLGAEDTARLRASIVRRGASAPSPAPERRVLPPPAALIGRDADAAQAIALLRDDDVRLLTFIGPPGVGKTGLALRVADELQAGYAGGAALVELAALADAAFIPTKLALTLGVHEVPGEPLVQTLLRTLGERPMLVVFDNFEHVLAGASFIAELLAGAPRLTVIATSRAALRIAGEREFAVGPLPVPAPQRRYVAAELAAVPTVALLVDRARATKHTFALTADNAPAIVEICRALDGVPLAIELVAPRLKIFSPAALAARLQRRLPLLEAERADRPTRHRTMRAALAWSYELLAAPEQAVLRRIAIFRGSFSVDAARAVCADLDGSTRLLSTLGGLADHNLLRIDDHDGEPYFELPALIREFAYEQFAAAADEFDAVHLALTTYGIETATCIRLDQTPDARRPLFERLVRESANFPVLLDWARSTGRTEVGVRFAYALWTFWYLRGTCADGLARTTALLEAAEAQPGSVPADLLANAYREMMSLATTSGAFELADKAATRALALKVPTGDRKGIAWISDVAGVIASQRGDYERAHALIGEALRLRRELGVPNDIGNSLQDLGHSLADSGDPEAGRTVLEESLTWYPPGVLGAGEALQLLGVIAARERDDDRAERLSREALEIGERHGHAMLVASARAVLAQVAVRRGAHAASARLYGEALDTFESAMFTEVPDVLDGLAAIAHATGHAREAARLVGGAAALRARMQKQIVPADRAHYESFMATVITALAAPVFDAEWMIGKSLPYPELQAEARALIAAIADS